MKKYIDILEKYNRLANFLCVSQMYLKNNFLNVDAITTSDLKSKISGHWGNASQVNFIYSHINRYITQFHEKSLLIIGTGHSGCALHANYLLENIPPKDMAKHVYHFGTDKGFRTEINPEYSGTVYDGGSLGYSLATAFGTVKLSKELTTFCLIGDGEAETATLSSSWLVNKLMNHNDGVVVPILNINGFKMSTASLYAQFSKKSLNSIFKGFNYKVYHLTYNHKNAIKIFNQIHKDIKRYRENKSNKLPCIILKIPKGYSAPDFNGIAVSDSLNSHKNPLSKVSEDNDQFLYLKNWLKSYQVSELIDENLNFTFDIHGIIPSDDLKLSKVKFHANELYCDNLDVKHYNHPSAMVALNNYLKDFVKQNKLLIYSPDELISNKLKDLTTYENSIEILNENICQAMMHGGIYTGKNAVFIGYEAFMSEVIGMISQEQKFLKTWLATPERPYVNSLNYVLTSVCWENCFSHQNPEVINAFIGKNYNFTDVVFPVNAFSTVYGFRKNITQHNKMNVLVVSKRNHTNSLSFEDSIKMVEQGYHVVKPGTKAKAAVIAVGDFMFDELLNLQSKVNNTALTYIYSLNFLKNLNNKQFGKLTGGANKIVILFHGYKSVIKDILFEHLLNKDVLILGYEDSYSSNGYKEKLNVNNISENVILNFLEK